MTHQEILTKAIEKAIAGGWKSPDQPGMDDYKFKTPIDPSFRWVWPWVLMRQFNQGAEVEVNIEHVIFSHDFAKALWGEADINYWIEDCSENMSDHYEGLRVRQKMWQLRLQEMVIADDPIAYLGEHLEG